METNSLIQIVLQRCEQERMLPPLKTRLVKLLYLAELEYYRRTRRRLTNLDWMFYHFGPYAFSLAPYLGDPDVDTLPLELQRLTSSGPGTRGETGFDHDAEAAVTDVVHEWGNADLNTLLDYVYFETEPMQSARRGDALDFSSVAPLHVTRRLGIKLDPNKIKELRKKLASRAPLYAELRSRTLGSDELFANLREWDSERAPRLRQGECEIDPKELVPPDEG